MKKRTIILAGIFATLGLFLTQPTSAFQLGIDVDVKVGLFVDTYKPKIKVPEFQSKYKVRDPDMEMLMAIKPHTSLSYADLWKERLKQDAWWWVIEKLGIKPDVVLPKFGKDHGPPYGNAYGYWRNQASGPGGGHPLGKDKGKKGKDKGKSKGQPQWSDVDLIDLVRVKTLAKLTGKSPDEVVKLKKAAGGWDNFAKKTKAERGKSGKVTKTKGKTSSVSKSATKSGGGKGKSGKGKSKK